MKLPRRQFLHLAAGAAAVPALSRTTWAQTYPARRVHIIVGLAAGGGTDVVARIMAESLSQYFGRQFIVENRTGTAGNLAAQTAISSLPNRPQGTTGSAGRAGGPFFESSRTFPAARARRQNEGVCSLVQEPLDASPQYPNRRRGRLARFLRFGLERVLGSQGHSEAYQHLVAASYSPLGAMHSLPRSGLVQYLFCDVPGMPNEPIPCASLDFRNDIFAHELSLAGHLGGT
jgi:hypothetical protein